MDFLDPRKRRAHSIRLMIGYVLIAIAIALGAVLLVYGAYGYGINTKTGDIIQNGLLFVDSQPGGTNIYLNDKTQGSTTASRLILPAGAYKLTLKKDGYRTWERSFTLTEHSIARYVYPFLFPVKPVVQAVKAYSATPPLLSQSPDRRWLLVETPESSSGVVTFDEYDTASLPIATKTLAMPAGLLTNADQAGSTLKEVEWSTDNKHLLLQHTYNGGTEFIIFNRDIPTESINVNKLLALSPSEVALRNKKFDQLYIWSKDSGDLQIANIGNSTVTPLLKNVLAFKPSGADLITYVTAQGMSSGEVTARIWDGNKSYPLYVFSAGSKYLIDMAQFQSHWYYIAGSNTDERINLYKDPLSGIRDPAVGKAVPLLSLNIKDASKVSFSTNTRFIEAEAGQELVVYDIEAQSAYHYTLTTPLADLLHWMDGHRLIGASGGSVFVTDYDSINQQLVVPTIDPQGGFFDRDYKHLFTISSGAGGITLESVDMRAGVDLPKTAQ
ncbi:MAG TPA: PEGA domain-containing protein [Candidatus Saccharimonadales bacterium]|nr:PEGA domain-containing protein [Candidatus Saccharimonadales bacterium]